MLTSLSQMTSRVQWLALLRSDGPRRRLNPDAARYERSKPLFALPFLSVHGVVFAIFIQTLPCTADALRPGHGPHFAA
jgi:hypothetical protein